MMLDLPETPAWMADALCAETDPEEFFPDVGGTSKHAKVICRSCPVIAECLAYALANDERHGVWGGVSERDRRAMTRQSRAAA